MKRRYRRLRWGLIALAIPLLLLAVYAAMPGRGRAVPFDAAGWRSSSERGRDQMVDDLLRSGRLIGLTESEVRGLLGEPDFATTDDGRVLKYHLGTRLGFHHFLRVCFHQDTGACDTAFIDD